MMVYHPVRYYDDDEDDGILASPSLSFAVDCCCSRCCCCCCFCCRHRFSYSACACSAANLRTSNEAAAAAQFQGSVAGCRKKPGSTPRRLRASTAWYTAEGGSAVQDGVPPAAAAVSVVEVLLLELSFLLFLLRSFSCIDTASETSRCA